MHPRPLPETRPWKTKKKQIAQKPTEEKKVDLQPLIDAIARNGDQIITDGFLHMKETARGNMQVETWIIGLAALIVISAGAVSIAAVFMNHFETAERIVIPLLSFAGGLGIGSRMTRKGGEAK